MTQKEIREKVEGLKEEALKQEEGATSAEAKNQAQLTYVAASLCGDLVDALCSLGAFPAYGTGPKNPTEAEEQAQVEQPAGHPGGG